MLDKRLRIGVAAIIERVDQNRLAAGSVGTDDQAGGLLQVGVEPWKEVSQISTDVAGTLFQDSAPSAPMGSHPHSATTER